MKLPRQLLAVTQVWRNALFASFCAIDCTGLEASLVRYMKGEDASEIHCLLCVGKPDALLQEVLRAWQEI